MSPPFLSACFADMGYQAVTAVFPLIIVIQLKEAAYVYGLLLALSYGVGSVFSLFGGKLGDTHEKKTIALVGNLLIPLMSISVLFPSIILLGVFSCSDDGLGTFGLRQGEHGLSKYSTLSSVRRYSVFFTPLTSAGASLR